jgi:cobalt-zinc-cadmium efflux system membrane fusion protein
MNQPRTRWVKPVILGVVLLVLVGVGVAAAPHVMGWLQTSNTEKNAPGEAPSLVTLIFDAEGRPGVEVSPEVVDALRITTAPVAAVTREKALPVQLGQLAYDIDRLYPVRSIANGKVTRIETKYQPAGLFGDQPFSFGDDVKKGQLLAVVRSPDLAEKKGAFVDAILDLTVDKEKLARLEGPYERGAIPENTYRDAIAKVQKDITALARARRILELAQLKPEEIKALEDEAETVKKRFRDRAKPKAGDDKKLWGKEQVESWARVEVRAPASGVIVEKNTNVGDIADPGKDPPLFRIADLKTLGVWIHPPEEYLPVLQKLLKERAQGQIRMEMNLQSDPDTPRLKGWLLRIAPSLDPIQRTPLLIGRIDNPGGKQLLIGQLVMTTIFVPQETGLVQIPMKALNEVHGQSLVFVQLPGKAGDKPRYIQRRVQVVNRFATTVQIRQGQKFPEDTLDDDSRKLIQTVNSWLDIPDPLYPGELVVTGGVVELASGLDDLIARARAEKK